MPLRAASHMEHYHNTAISFGSLKDALLHFEYVIPLNVAGQFTGLRPSIGNNPGVEKFGEAAMKGFHELNELHARTKDLQNLYPPHLRDHPIFKHVANMFDGFLFAFMIRNIEGEEVFCKYVKTLGKVVNSQEEPNPDSLRVTDENLRKLFSKLTRDFQLSDTPVDCPWMNFLNQEASSPVNILKIPHIRVIDTDSVSIGQILDLREDEEIMKRMRKFRLFAHEEYNGKDRAFVEDDIQKKLDDYSDAVKASGFETKLKTLSFVMESKLVMGSLATSAAALLIGSPNLALSAFGAGTILEIGKLTLEFAKQKHTLANICRENPVSYLSEVQDRLSAASE